MFTKLAAATQRLGSSRRLRTREAVVVAAPTVAAVTLLGVHHRIRASIKLAFAERCWGELLINKRDRFVELLNRLLDHHAGPS